MATDRFTPLTEMVDFFTLGKMESAIFGEIRSDLTIVQRIKALHRVINKQPNFLLVGLDIPDNSDVGVAISNNNHVIRELYKVLIGHIERMEKVTLGFVDTQMTSLSTRLKNIQACLGRVDKYNPQVEESMQQLSLR